MAHVLRSRHGPAVAGRRRPGQPRGDQRHHPRRQLRLELPRRHDRRSPRFAPGGRVIRRADLGLPEPESRFVGHRRTRLPREPLPGSGRALSLRGLRQRPDLESATRRCQPGARERSATARDRQRHQRLQRRPRHGRHPPVRPARRRPETTRGEPGRRRHSTASDPFGHGGVLRSDDAHPRPRPRRLRAQRFLLVRPREKTPLVRAAGHREHVWFRRGWILESSDRGGLGETLRPRTDEGQRRKRAPPRDAIPGQDRDRRLRRDVPLERGTNRRHARARRRRRPGVQRGRERRRANPDLAFSRSRRVSDVSHAGGRSRVEFQHPAAQPGTGAARRHREPHHRARPSGLPKFGVRAGPGQPTRARGAGSAQPFARIPRPLLPRCELLVLSPARWHRARLVGRARRRAAVVGRAHQRFPDRQRRRPVHPRDRAGRSGPFAPPAADERARRRPDAALGEPRARPGRRSPAGRVDRGPRRPGPAAASEPHRQSRRPRPGGQWLRRFDRRVCDRPGSQQDCARARPRPRTRRRAVQHSRHPRGSRAHAVRPRLGHPDCGHE